ncbi:hypothetical protein CRX72_20775 [Pantoea sp. BRM17]|nr:hypothetical protein CRX72_20775 [Pantoea sp. BRM17]
MKFRFIMNRSPVSINADTYVAQRQRIFGASKLSLLCAEHSLLYKNKTKGNTFLLREAGCQTLLYSQCKLVQL